MLPHDGGRVDLRHGCPRPARKGKVVKRKGKVKEKEGEGGKEWNWDAFVCLVSAVKRSRSVGFLQSGARLRKRRILKELE